MLRVYQSHQSITNQAHLIPLTCPIQLGPDLTIFILDSSIFLFSDFTQPSYPIQHLTTTTRSRLHRSSISHSVQLFLLDLICAFYRSNFLFTLSESTLPEQQRLHDNLSHNPICCRLLFPVIFGSILLNSCDKILHHSGQIN